MAWVGRPLKGVPKHAASARYAGGLPVPRHPWGQPVVDFGVPIYLILDMLAQGFLPEEMRNDYGIIAKQVCIALRFAAEWVKREGSDAA